MAFKSQLMTPTKVFTSENPTTKVTFWVYSKFSGCMKNIRSTEKFHTQELKKDIAKSDHEII